ncbi:hypothetical protein ABPG72_000510 [Tetrahymena utriculariae]
MRQTTNFVSKTDAKLNILNLCSDLRANSKIKQETHHQMKLLAFLLIVAVVAVKAAEEIPQCLKDLLKKAQNNQICQQGDTDCLKALKSLDYCSINCMNQNESEQPQTFNCFKSNCQPTNPTAKAYFNETIQCKESSSKSYHSTVVFSILFIIIFSLI